MYRRGAVGAGLLLITAAALAGSGAFAIAQSIGGAFLPHDEAWLGMTAAQLAAYQDGRIVEFMFHDRVSFGGTLLAIAILYAWIVLGPLRRGERWAWWTLAASGTAGFLSFLAYLGYGYLDTWHGVATLLLLPVFVAGLVLARPAATARAPWAGRSLAMRWCGPSGPAAGSSRARLGHALVTLACVGMVVAGAVILSIGATAVFVPQDLSYIGLGAGDIERIHRGLVPLIAHDRAGFGGGLASTGLAALGVAVFATPTVARWRALCAAGSVGFGAAIGVHVAIGYTDLTHLGPAILGAGVLAVGLALSAPAPRAISRRIGRAPAAARGAPGGS